MFRKIENSAAPEMPSVIHFLNARNMKPADIYRRLCEVYGDNAMGDSMVRRRVRHCNEGLKNMYDDPRSGRPSVVNEDLVRTVEENIQENRRFTISSLSLHFPQISLSIFTKYCLTNFVFRNCVHAGYRSCCGKTQNEKGRPVF
jgi:hypothetical protein